MRLVSALAVLVGHSFTLTGLGAAPRVLGIPIHSLGLYGFFAISGYLIAASWQRHPHLIPYVVNRCLRIFPALGVVVIVTVLLVGPAVTSLERDQYFQSDLVYRYLLNLALTAQYDLPGVFESGHRSTAVNGVLWTLGLEFVCYLVVAVIGVFLRARAAWGYLIFGIAAATLAQVPTETPGLGWLGPAGTTWVFFAAGAVLSRVSGRWFHPAGLVPLILVWITTVVLLPGSALTAAWLALPWVLITAGRAALPGVRRAGRFGDLSYGLYLWGFLVQQLVIEQFDILPAHVNIVLVVVSTGALAWLSWHLVEKHALTHRMGRGLPRPHQPDPNSEPDRVPPGDPVSAPGRARRA